MTKLKAVLDWLGAALTAVVGQLNSAKMTLTEILGAVGTLAGVGALTGWEYAAIIGGIAVIFAIERQPDQPKTPSAKATVAKASALKKALQAAQAGGKLEVLVEDVLKAL
jgi:ABC-type molybdate transport system substrate-binding protein